MIQSFMGINNIFSFMRGFLSRSVTSVEMDALSSDQIRSSWKSLFVWIERSFLWKTGVSYVCVMFHFLWIVASQNSSIFLRRMIVIFSQLLRLLKYCVLLPIFGFVEERLMTLSLYVWIHIPWFINSWRNWGKSRFLKFFSLGIVF